jgi:hypothetical protein
MRTRLIPGQAAPRLEGLSPTHGKTATTVTITAVGYGFVYGSSVIRVAGVAKPTRFLSSTELAADALLPAAGPVAVDVASPPQATTSALSFTVDP